MSTILTTDDLIKQLMTTPTRDFLERLSAKLRQDKFDLGKIIDLTFHPDAQVGFRAARLLDTTMLANPQLYTEHLPYFVQRMTEVTNASCKRHYARIMMHLTNPGSSAAIRDKLKETDLEGVVEQCFDWLIDPKVKVAVKVCAANTLFYLCGRYGWIKEELTTQVQFMLRDGSPAIQLRGRKLLALIEKLKV